MKFNPVFYIPLLLIISFASSCEKDPEIPNEEELITTVTIRCTPHGGGAEKVLRFEDPDGDGGIAPVITGDPFDAGIHYHCAVELLNESETPAENITEEIEEEDEEHQFFFMISGVDATIEYDDMDANGDPVGLHFELHANAAGTGTLTLVLRHQPDKSAQGVSSGDITNAGGETDIEVTFPLIIQ